MPLDRVALKARARDLISTVRPHPCLIGTASMIVSMVLELLIGDVTGNLEQLMSTARSAAELESALSGYAQNINPWGQFLGVALAVMALIWSVGFTIFCLRVTRGQPAGLGNLMDGFGMFFRILWLYILIGLFTFLWSLLLIVPGIVAGFRYSQAIYILIDSPDMRPMECIRRSARLMRGHKAELFVLNLSLIGWRLLTVVPFTAIWVLPYTELIFAGYYNWLIGWPGRGGETAGEPPEY